MPWAWRWPRSCWRPSSTAPGTRVVDHRTYAFLGDGCLMEGISHEVCSLAGTLRLSKLVALYDDNGISIDGHVEGWFTDDTPARFRAYGWHVVGPIDGHDSDAVDRALTAARAQGDDRGRQADADRLPHRHRPGRADQGRWPRRARRSAGRHRTGGLAHGAGLDLGAVRGARSPACGLGRPRARCRAAVRLGRAAWPPTAAEHPALAAEFQRRMAGDLPAGFDADVAQALDELAGSAGAVATRKASQLALDALAPALPELFGGSADLTGSEPHQFQGLHGGRPRPAGQPPELGRARIRHGRRAQRHGAARRLHPLRRHLPDLQRLQPQRHPHGGADEAARDPRLHARQHRPGRRRADPPERGARAIAAPDSPTWTSGARPIRWRRPSPGPSRCAGATAPARWRCRARRCRWWRRRPTWRRRSPAAATCWPTRPARVP